MRSPWCSRAARPGSLSFAKGWPQIKYPDSPGWDNWGIQYYFNSAGEKLRKKADGSDSLPGIELGPPVPLEESGHPALRCARRRASRCVPAAISRSPPYIRDSIWENLFSGREKIVGRYTLDMSGIWERGPLVPGTRWGRRIRLGFSRQERRQMTREWEQANGQGEKPQNTHDALKQLQRQRDTAKDALKVQIAAVPGDRAPSWFRRAGIQGLRTLKEHHPETAAWLEPWEQMDSRLGDRIAFLLARAAARLEENYTITAHRICQYLLENGVRRIAVEDSFLQKMVSRQDADIPESLKRSARSASMPHRRSSFRF